MEDTVTAKGSAPLRRLALREEGDEGFTLVEILVVIIIIGILAAVAIPIFLNQQRAARDSATTQDARNLVMNIETGLATIPDPTQITILPQSEYVAEREIYDVVIRDGDKEVRIEASKTKGTRLNAYKVGDRYQVTAWNPDGLEYTTPTSGNSILLYDSISGGFKTHTYA